MPHAFPGPSTDPLFEVELQIARRADEIARQRSENTSRLNLQCWLFAEAELLGKYFDAINAFPRQGASSRGR